MSKITSAHRLLIEDSVNENIGIQKPFHVWIDPVYRTDPKTRIKSKIGSSIKYAGVNMCRNGARNLEDLLSIKHPEYIFKVFPYTGNVYVAKNAGLRVVVRERIKKVSV